MSDGNTRDGDPEGLEVFSVRDTLRNPPPALEPLVEGLMFKGEQVAIAGPRGAYKSFLAMDMARLLAAGRGHLLGHFAVVKASRVLIAQGELDRGSAAARWATLCAGMEAPEGLMETFDPFRLTVVRRQETERYMIDKERHQETISYIDATIDDRLETTIDEYDIDVLVFDPWRTYFVGAENSNDEQEAALSALTGLAREKDLTLILMHHFGQSGGRRDPEDQWRGATRLPDWASLRITLAPYYTAKAAKQQGLSRAQARQFAWALFLARRDETPRDMPIRFDTDTLRWKYWSEAGEAAESRRKTIPGEDVVAACMTAGGDWPSIKQAAADLGVSQQTAKRWLLDAVGEGKLVEYAGPRDARGFRLTDPRGTL